jgi:hypothetical protein
VRKKGEKRKEKKRRKKGSRDWWGLTSEKEV